MNGWEYIVNSAAWSVGGLAVGWFLGRMERDVRDIKQRLDEREREEKR